MSWRCLDLGLAACRIIQELAEAALILNCQLLDLRRQLQVVERVDADGNDVGTDVGMDVSTDCNT